MNVGPGGSPADDDDIAQLLRKAGERERPDMTMRAEVRAAVEAEWRQLVSARDRWRRRAVWAMAAGVAMAAVGVWLVRPMLIPGPEAVAVLERTTGTVEGRVDAGRDWQLLSPGAPITALQEIRTAADARASLTLSSGIELRIDQATRLAFDRTGEASLHQGAAYVDTGPGADPRADGFALRTSSGTVRHVGTQYEARLGGVGLRVAIREGSVRIDTPNGPVSGAAGEQILLADGRVSRRELPTDDAAWDWVGSVSPAYAIEGRTLSEFLRWAARETGRDLVFSSADVEREAARIVLRGSVEGLGPDESVAAVTATTGLNIVVASGRIEVEPASR